MTERLAEVGIMRDGVVERRGCDSHYQLRQALTGNGDERKPGDIEGFVTNEGRFLTRREAIPIAIKAGQISKYWANAKRDLLSSDIDWDGAPKVEKLSAPEVVTEPTPARTVGEASRQVRRAQERREQKKSRAALGRAMAAMRLR